MTELILAFLPIIVIIVLLILILTQGYVKAPPDHAYIISGIRKEPRVLIGRAGLKIPFFEQIDKLYLGQITVDIKTDEYIPTNDFIKMCIRDSYDSDAASSIRKSHENPAIKELYATYLGEPGSSRAHHLLHTTYVKRSINQH